ncbi:MAG: NADH-quinone oxidoreductase subunit H [Alphaproteobacteria bacterium]
MLLSFLKLFFGVLAIILPVIGIAIYFAWKDGRILIKKSPKRFPLSFTPTPYSTKKESASLPDIPGRVPLLIAIFIFILPLLGWLAIPFGEDLLISDMSTGLLFILGILLIKIYEVIFYLSSTAQNNPYIDFKKQIIILFGATVTIGLSIIPIILISGALNLSDIVESQEGLWFSIFLFPVFITFFCATLLQADCFFFFLQKNPFYKDEPIASLLFILSKYIYLLLLSALSSLIFLGGWLPPFAVLPFIFVPGFVWLILKTMAVFLCYQKLLTSSLIKKYENKWKHLFLFSILWIIGTALFLLKTGNSLPY